MSAALGDYVDFSAGGVPPARTSQGRYPVYGSNGVIGRTCAANARGPLIVIGRVGSFCGSLRYCGGDVWVTDNALICRARQPDETRYWYYALKHCQLNRFRAGSGQPLLNQSILRSVPIDAADASRRRPIADVLGAFDDKIAANAGVITAAEALMTTLVARVTEFTTLSSLARTSTRCVQPQRIRGTVAHYSFPAFDDTARPILADANTIKSAKLILTQPCVLFSKLNPGIPRIWNVLSVPSEPALASTEFVVLHAVGIDNSVLWSALNQPDVSAILAQMAAGMTGSRQRITPSELLGVRVRDVRRLDSAVAVTISSLGAMCERRRAESARLAAVRDELLSPLIAGAVQIR